MSKKIKELSAVEAIAQAKKNALKRKDETAKLLLLKALEAIDQMVTEGVVRVSLFLTEDEYKWGAPQVMEHLRSLGYEVEPSETEKEDEIPDMVISIEHLK